jgi:hypothetical protein
LVLCSILLAIEFGFCIFIGAGTHGLIVPLKRPTSTDFVSFYAAGSLADAGTPFLAYDQAAHYAAEEHARSPGIVYNFFFYPPTFLLICAVLARVPYLAAFIGFEVATLGFYVLVVRRILGAHGWQIVIPILAFPPVLWTIGLGQNGLLTAGLFGAATLLVDRRPFAAGLVFGALCCKPHFALLVPVALAAAGRWRALAGAREYRLPQPAQWLLAGLYILCLNPRGLAADWHLPIGTLIALAVSMLVGIIALRPRKVPAASAFGCGR